MFVYKYGLNHVFIHTKYTLCRLNSRFKPYCRRYILYTSYKIGTLYIIVFLNYNLVLLYISLRDINILKAIFF